MAFESMGEYMREKNRKIQLQHGSNRLPFEERKSNLFKDVVLYVNGITKPSLLEISDICWEHGGVAVERTYTSRVTHVIAPYLPPTKLQLYNSMIKPPALVTIDWFVDSVKKLELQPTYKYIIPRFQSLSQQQLPFRRIIEKKPTKSSKVIDLTTSPISTTSTSSSSSNIKCTDPDFVESFFAKSRLHHIGTWKRRFDKLKPSFKQHKPLYPLPLSSSSSNRIIMHIDMDCFFVSVGIRNEPNLHNQPVAVAHGDGNHAEISSCNYKAREYGVSAGSWMKEAKKKCPNLIIIPYNFNEYARISEEIYHIFFKYTPLVECVSCDEALLEFQTAMTIKEMEHVANQIRNDIYEKTKCNASAGVGPNILLARLATHHAKPNGTHVVTEISKYSLLNNMTIKNIPGIGRKTLKKFQKDLPRVKTCEDLRKLPKNILQMTFGKNLGSKLYSYSRGVDHRSINDKQGQQQSLSADINWGLRFKTHDQIHTFLKQLTTYIMNQLLSLQPKQIANRITLTILIRHPEAPIKAQKYLGCGKCDKVTETKNISNNNRMDYVVIQLYDQSYMKYKFMASDLRGVGIKLTKLTTKSMHSSNSFFSSSSSSLSNILTKTTAIQDNVNWISPPSLDEINEDVLKELTPAMRSEIQRKYGKQREKRKISIENVQITMKKKTMTKKQRELPPPPSSSSSSWIKFKQLLCKDILKITTTTDNINDDIECRVWFITNVLDVINEHNIDMLCKILVTLLHDQHLKFVYSILQIFHRHHNKILYNHIREYIEKHYNNHSYICLNW